METKELRIGNLLIDKYSKHIIPVSELLRNGNIVFDIECFGIWEAEPIPLTEEWLLKFGFRQYNGKFTYDLEKLSICLSGNEYKNGRTYFNSWCIIESQPLYVHQLQNLYYALTGIELLNKQP